MKTEKIIEIFERYSNSGVSICGKTREECFALFKEQWSVVASELQQLFDEQLKGCWQAGVEYGSNRTDKNFNDFKEQEEKQ